MNKTTILKISILFLIPMLFIFPSSAYYLNGTILNNSDATGLSNALVLQNSSQYLYNSTEYFWYWTNSTTTNSTGYYSLINATSGNFTFSNNPGFYQNVSNISITGNTIGNVNLSLKPTGTITGCVWVFEHVGICNNPNVIIIYSMRIRWFW
jgi:hypothetical protein